nr:PREDICTED: caspase-1-like isoform X2 [Bemisia tabaci]
MDGENVNSNGVSETDARGDKAAGAAMFPQNGRGETKTEVTSASRGCSFYKDTAETVTARMASDRDAWYYNMNHKNRGIAIIFNHENFTNPKLKTRCGTKTDCENLASTLRSLRFEVYTYFDASYSKVMSVISEVRNMDHSDNDCFLMAVLSHGEQNIIHAYDSPYQPEDLWHPFTADKCPSLAGKPKLFFIQACQGDRLDPGVTLMKRTETDSGPMSYRIPVHADFLIAYSTIPERRKVRTRLGRILAFFSCKERRRSRLRHQQCCYTLTPDEGTENMMTEDQCCQGFYSWRNTQRGSWFMQALCEELKKHCYSLDLLTILTFVNRRVATDYQSNVPGNNEMDAQKQIPCITYMLTRLLKFKPK